jgi:DNA (cytosine-5)-methyltransferase 1
VVVPPALLSAGQTVFVTSALTRVALKWQSMRGSSMLVWHLSLPPTAPGKLEDIIDHSDQNWWPEIKVKKLLDAVSPRHRELLSAARSKAELMLATVYRRTRTKDGVKQAFAEVRFDGIAGCLRTPSGGSSRQFWLFIQGEETRVRPINAREAMRLMGVPDSYRLPQSQLAGLKIAGDGVAVPVVTWLSGELLGPLVGG